MRCDIFERVSIRPGGPATADEEPPQRCREAGPAGGPGEHEAQVNYARISRRVLALRRNR